jgi:hypothetical protein
MKGLKDMEARPGVHKQHLNHQRGWAVKFAIHEQQSSGWKALAMLTVLEPR